MRSNISISDDGTVSRKSKKYSGKTVDLEQLMDDIGLNDT